MSRDKKIWWGLLSFVPIVGILIYMVLAFQTILPLILDSLNSTVELDPESMLNQMAGLWISLALISLISAAIWVCFIVFSIKDRSNKGDEQVLWVLVLFFFSIIALPIYWYFRMWKNPEFSFEENLTQRTN